MSSDFLKFNKGPMGYMIDMRQAMSRVREAASQWIDAFDCGDFKAIEDIGRIIGEAGSDFQKAAKALEEMQK